MQKHQNRRKTQRKQGGKTKKSSASKTGKKGTRYNRLKKLFSTSTSTYESSPAADAIKIKRAAALPFFNTYKAMAIKEGRLMPSMVTPVRI